MTGRERIVVAGVVSTQTVALTYRSFLPEVLSFGSSPEAGVFFDPRLPACDLEVRDAVVVAGAVTVDVSGGDASSTFYLIGGVAPGGQSAMPHCPSARVGVSGGNVLASSPADAYGNARLTYHPPAAAGLFGYHVVQWQGCHTTELIELSIP